MTTVHGTRLPDLSGASLRRAVDDVVDPYLDPLNGESVLLVPDVHYPYHPSTGLVTNPAVVRALTEVVITSTDATSVRIGLPPARYTEEESGCGLWYESVAADCGIELVDLDECPSLETPVHLPEESASIDVPEPMVDDTVVAVPTIRRDDSVAVASAMVCLAQALFDSPGPRDARLAVHACDPAVTVLDGTYVFAGEPQSSRILAATADPVAASHLASDLLNLDPSDVPHLDSHEGAVRGPEDVVGLRPREVAGAIPDADPPGPDDDALVARGYRLYARAVGDLVPPQLLGGGPGE